MPEASPAKWHLSHTSWFFESLVLQSFCPGYRVFDPNYAYLFNSYYNSLGERHARPARGMLSRPALADVLAYRDHVDTAMSSFLDQAGASAQQRIELGLHHEQQHQELLLTDIKHAFHCHPFKPAYCAATDQATEHSRSADWLRIEAGLYEIGHDGLGFAFDNEGPRHKEYLSGCDLALNLVSNRDYLAFIESGGYQDPQYWLSDGWDWREAENILAPLYWRRAPDHGWQEFSLHGEIDLPLDAPVCHLSFYEADAYARWAGARLPTEAEWEVGAVLAQAEIPPHGGWHPQANAFFQQVWQWTSSAYQTYPGYRPPDGALAEYNAKFACNQMVLRGSSAFTPAGHARLSYRNFFHPPSRWQLSGLRLAKDI